jgi:hypothetical protein
VPIAIAAVARLFHGSSPIRRHNAELMARRTDVEGPLSDRKPPTPRCGDDADRRHIRWHTRCNRRQVTKVTMRRSRLDDRTNRTGPVELVPIGILPAQLIELRHRRSKWTPELRLMVAVLDDAIRTYRRCASSRMRGAPGIFDDTVEWFASRDASSPGAFESICDALGLDPESIRESLRACHVSRVVRRDDADDAALASDASYDRTLACLGALLSCLTLASVVLLGALFYESWGFAHVHVFLTASHDRRM